MSGSAEYQSGDWTSEVTSLEIKLCIAPVLMAKVTCVQECVLLHLDAERMGVPRSL